MSEQNLTDYAPTEKEQQILDALLDPNNRLKSITDICRIVRCSRTLYYNAFAKPEFVEYYKLRSAELATRHLGPIMNAFVTMATRGSFNHGRVLLEMAGAYTPRIKEDVTVKSAHEDALAELE